MGAIEHYLRKLTAVLWKFHVHQARGLRIKHNVLDDERCLRLPPTSSESALLPSTDYYPQSTPGLGNVNHNHRLNYALVFNFINFQKSTKATAV